MRFDGRLLLCMHPDAPTWADDGELSGSIPQASSDACQQWQGERGGRHIVSWQMCEIIIDESRGNSEEEKTVVTTAKCFLVTPCEF